tara:strand:+ start:540 stop:842 length:303 start_codon:yes stop_codon:yes gene_type:complete
MGIIYKVIEKKIVNQLKPEVLIIKDVSHLHKGHIGISGKELGETHFDLTIVSNKFINKSRIERQRILHKLLKEELNERIHALSLNLSTVIEYKSNKIMDV